MAASRHNLSRRAVPGAGVCACAAAAHPPDAEAGAKPSRARWTRTLAAYRRAEARVAAFNAAVAPVPGTTPLWTLPGDSWGDATVRHSWHEGQPVRRVDAVAVTLSSLLAGPVDLVKLDVEGVEAAILAEAAPRLDRVRRLVLEFHGSSGNPANRLDEVLETLRGAGFHTRVEQDGRVVSPRRVRRDDPFWLIVRAWRRERGIGRKGPRR